MTPIECQGYVGIVRRGDRRNFIAFTGGLCGNFSDAKIFGSYEDAIRGSRELATSLHDCPSAAGVNESGELIDCEVTDGWDWLIRQQGYRTKTT